MTSKFFLYKLQKNLKSPKKVLFALWDAPRLLQTDPKIEDSHKKCEKVLDKIMEVR